MEVGLSPFELAGYSSLGVSGNNKINLRLELFLKKIVNLICILIGATSLLTACTSVKTQEPKLDCGPWIFGIAKASTFNKQFLSEAWVQEARAECLKTIYAKKFDDYDPPVDDKFVYRTEELGVKRRPTRATRIGDGAERVLDSHKLQKEVFKSSLRGANYNFEFNAYGKWEGSISPSRLYQVFAKNRENQSALFISVYDANPFLIWSDSRDSMYVRVRDQLAYSDLTKIKETNFQNFEGFQVEYRGRDKNGVPLHFLSTQIRIDKKILYLTSWCFEEDYAGNEEDFHLIANSLRMQPRLWMWSSEE